MLKVKPTTKEQLIYYLLQHISLGTYDKKFLNNLMTMYIAKDVPVTTNQSNLLDKIILRYARQLAKQEHDSTDMVNLPWKHIPIPSAPEFTEAFLKIADGNIELRSPYKTNFINELRQIEFSNWNRETKTWYIPFSETSLKQVIKTTTKHYNTVNYCDSIQDILNTVAEYESCQYWNPTLVKRNGNLFIAATNAHLNEALQKYVIDDSLSTLARLVYHGVDIDESVINDLGQDEKVIQFVINRSTALPDDVELIIEYLQLIGADFVLVREWQFWGANFYNHLKEGLQAAKIPYEIPDKRKYSLKQDLKSVEMPVIIGSMMFSVPLSHIAGKAISLISQK